MTPKWKRVQGWFFHLESGRGCDISIQFKETKGLRLKTGI